MVIGRQPIVVLHSAGEIGSGGPVMSAQRLLVSSLAQRYQLVSMHQPGVNGGINVRMLREWVRQLREVQPDLVHVFGLQNEGLHGVLAARIARCRRILLTIHGTVRDITSRPTWRSMVLRYGAEPLTLRGATHVATVCEYAAGRSFLLPHQAKFLGVLPNGVPIPADPTASRDRMRAQLGLSAKDQVLITVSRLSWEKGFETLARALPRLATGPQRTVLLVVGDGPDRPGIEALLDCAAGVEVRLLGRRMDVADLLSAADLFVFPTLHENLSLALLEAMAQGLPVIATSVGGNVEIVARGGGLLVPARDPVALAAGIGRLLADPGERQRLGAAARRVVADNYSIERMVATLDCAYQRVLAA